MDFFCSIPLKNVCLFTLQLTKVKSYVRASNCAQKNVLANICRDISFHRKSHEKVVNKDIEIWYDNNKATKLIFARLAKKVERKTEHTGSNGRDAKCEL